MDIIKDIKFLCFRYINVKHYALDELFKRKLKYYIKEGTMYQLADYIREKYPSGLIEIEVETEEEFNKLYQTVKHLINTNIPSVDIEILNKDKKEVFVKLEILDKGIIKLILKN